MNNPQVRSVRQPYAPPAVVPLGTWNTLTLQISLPIGVGNVLLPAMDPVKP